MLRPMGRVELRREETVFFPTPYDENQETPFVITSQRVLHLEGEKRREIEAAQVRFVGPSSSRPLIFLALFFLLCGLPVVGYGVLRWRSVLGMPSFAERPPTI